MNELFAVLAQSEEINLILLIGVAIFFGTVGAKIFRRFRVPQIIGYIVIGVTLGPILKMISAETITTLEPFNVLALGIIGFLIGGELKKDIFAKFGKQVFSILLFEGVTAFLLVGVLSFFVMLLFSVGWHTSLAAALVFGAICSATDPASTVNVLWEYKTRGPLTTMLTTIVALDDGLALVLYIVSVSIAGVITGHNVDGGMLRLAFHAFYEIIGSLGLGAIGGLVLGWIIKRVKDDETMLVFTTGTIVLTIGVAASVGMDVILSSMALGVTLINMIPRRSLKSIELVRKFSPPIYVLFFVIIGSRLNVSSISGRIWLLAGVYIVGSIVGKTAGAYWGASYSKSAATIKKYLGFCLYPQGTIAIALLIMASTRFEGAVKDTMISAIII
ncbi:MAG: cation:proton antiporter, partial [Planctomycetota bacterium]